MIEPRSLLAALLAAAGTAAGVVAQTSAPTVAVHEERIREVLAFLASDELAGRDSPSPGLDRAAEFLAGAFESAGLRPMGGAGWFHAYALPGLVLDSAAIDVTVLGEPPLPLAAGGDVRLWSSSRPFASESVACTVVRGVPDRRTLYGSRQPVLIEVAADSPLWTTAGVRRTALESRRVRGSAPVLLVRAGLLPAGDEVRAALRVPAPEPAEVPLRNVVAVYPGTALEAEFVLVTAHYDHVGVNPAGDDVVFNGADDNGTGTAAVLALAEAFARARPALRRSVMFVCFSAEEKGLRGSRAFVAEPPVPLGRIAVVVNLEMLGRPPAGARGKAWITGRDLSDFEAIAEPVFAARGVELIDFRAADMLFGASDNLPFAQRGIVAHSISAGELHEDYHRPSDEAARIDVEHMAGVVAAVGALVVELADRDGRPAYNEKGRERLELGR